MDTLQDSEIQHQLDHPRWVHDMRAYLRPYWDKFLGGPFIEGVRTRRLSIPEMQGWILQMYPFIHTFPKFLAMALQKVEDDDAREYFIMNIRVERSHARHWLDMGEGFGVSRHAMLEIANGDGPVLRDVQSLTDWLWTVNSRDTLAEAVAATSFAIEGLTGDLSRKVLAGFESYGELPGVRMDRQTSRWVREHAKYDDDHPKIALEIVKRYATTERVQKRVMLAAKRSAQLLDLALDVSYRAYSIERTAAAPHDLQRRMGDRRKHAITIPFPDRRFAERRGHAGYAQS